MEVTLYSITVNNYYDYATREVIWVHNRTLILYGEEVHEIVTSITLFTHLKPL